MLCRFLINILLQLRQSYIRIFLEPKVFCVFFPGLCLHPVHSCFNGFALISAHCRAAVWPHTFVSPSADSNGAVVSYWRKYVHEVLVNCLGGLSLPRKSVVRLTGRSHTTLDVYRGRCCCCCFVVLRPR